jgi:hypothetical protein
MPVDTVPLDLISEVYTFLPPRQQNALRATSSRTIAAPIQVATSVTATLRTGNERQRAQWAHIVGGELLSSTLH